MTVKNEILVTVLHTFLRPWHENFQRGKVQHAARLDVACDIRAPFGVSAAPTVPLCHNLSVSLTWLACLDAIHPSWRLSNKPSGWINLYCLSALSPTDCLFAHFITASAALSDHLCFSHPVHPFASWFFFFLVAVNPLPALGFESFLNSLARCSDRLNFNARVPSLHRAAAAKRWK